MGSFLFGAGQMDSYYYFLFFGRAKGLYIFIPKKKIGGELGRCRPSPAPLNPSLVRYLGQIFQNNYRIKI
jgi:hypothetical protein